MYGMDGILRYRVTRDHFFRWKDDCGLVLKLNMAVIMACFTGLGAQLRIYTPFTPVPITGQVFFVLLSAILLGKWWGGISQTIYVSIGLLGVPWFSPNAGMPAFSKGGVSVIFGATGGYLIGFIIAAFIMGYMLDRSLLTQKNPMVLIVTMLSGILVIHILGISGLYIVVAIVSGAGVASQAVVSALILFLPLDILKAAGAGALSYGILPRKIT